MYSLLLGPVSLVSGRADVGVAVMSKNNHQDKEDDDKHREYGEAHCHCKI